MSKKSVKHWSAKRKQEVVLRLLRGESLDELSWETGQAAAVSTPMPFVPISPIRDVRFSTVFCLADQAV